jgi:hypothetical protein
MSQGKSLSGEQFGMSLLVVELQMSQQEEEQLEEEQPKTQRVGERLVALHLELMKEQPRS